MGLFSVGCRVENQADRDRFATVAGVLVDTGSELTWIRGDRLAGIGIEREKNLRFVMANGATVARSVGFAVIRVGRSSHGTNAKGSAATVGGWSMGGRRGWAGGGAGTERMRGTGPALGRFTVDEVVFAEAGDLELLGARTLEGLNLKVDSRNKELVAAGPLVAAGNMRIA